MADSQPTPKAGGTLDLSTGKPAPPPKPPPAPPPMPDDADPSVRAGKTLDLSKRAASPSRRRAADVFGSGLAVRETLDLSTETPAPDATAPPQSTPPKTDVPNRKKGPKRSPKSSGGSRERGKAPASAASSLADLLDPEVLAKLRSG